MSKPDAYMRWYWGEFWGAVHGLNDREIVAYQRCISFYYHQIHATGIKDDERFLRGLCNASEKSDEDWQEIRDAIFDNDRFFCQDGNGLWHQKRASEEWRKAVEDYGNACRRTEAARQAKLKKMQQQMLRRK